jgi:EAL domain-containing protein (putative c-di-GMP-specific phosphodiesterase class I)
LEALALRSALAATGRPDGAYLALNVSPRALLSPPVRDALPHDLSGIVIELTEHELFGAEGELEAELASLRGRGARVALDDAGAGYAGLQQLIRVAPDILKLDRTLVHGAHADGNRQALLEALIAFAGSTGAVVCAEGVEDPADLRVLVDMDVTYAQGYGLARPGEGWPVPAADVTAPTAFEIRAGLRMATAPVGAAGAFARGLAELSQTLGSATNFDDMRHANRAASALLGAAEVALLRYDEPADRLVLVTAHQRFNRGDAWPLDHFPATRYVIDHGTPGQIVAGDPGADPAELGELERTGMATMLIVPVVLGGRTLAVLELYRAVPMAFTTREIDRARVMAHQFAAALDRLTA